MPQSLENSKIHKGNLIPVDEFTERIARLVVDAAYKVHVNLGPGLLEKVYEICFCHELEKRGLTYQRQIDIPIV